MAQTFGSVRRQVEYVLVALLCEQPLNELDVVDAALHEARPRRQVIHKAAAEIIQHGYCLAAVHKLLGHMRADETRRLR